MARITYGKDKKELGVSDPKAVEYLLKQRLNRTNQNSIIDTNNKVDYKSPIKVIIDAPAVKIFFAKKNDK